MRDRFEQLQALCRPFNSGNTLNGVMDKLSMKRAVYLPTRVLTPGTAQQLHWQQWKLY